MQLPSTIRYEKKGRVAVVTINRPEALNALTPEMLSGLEEAFRDFSADRDLWAAVLTGVGEKALCAGADTAQAVGPPGVAIAGRSDGERRRHGVGRAAALCVHVLAV